LIDITIKWQFSRSPLWPAIDEITVDGGYANPEERRAGRRAEIAPAIGELRYPEPRSAEERQHPPPSFSDQIVE
jgi:hypothetical protein